MSRKLVLGLALVSLIGVVSAAIGDWTADSSTDSFNIESGDVSASLSVNEFGSTVANVSSIYVDNNTQSRSFNVSVSGNVSQLLDFPGTVTNFNNESGSFPLVGNVPVDQQFGSYTGNLSLTGLDNSIFSESVNVSVEVVDDISPEFTDVSIGSVMSTESVDWGLETSDNLNTTRVTGSVVREYNNSNSTLVNESVKSFNFSRDGQVEEWSYTFSDTDVIGDYYLRLTAFDESGNNVSRVESFQVNGLDSISVSETNFVFDTFRPKESTGFDLVNSSIDGKEFTISLGNLSYGGNESVQLGVVPPGGESPEILSVGESRSYSESGVYEVVLLHSGNDELKGTHRVTGSISVDKPEVHVLPLTEEVSFSGTVKNLDKPPEECLQVAEFDACISYSFDSSKKMFEEEYGAIDNGNSSYAWKISRLPIDQVEGTNEWKDSTSFTMGEYNSSLTNAINEKEKAQQTANKWKKSGIASILGLVIFVMITFGNSYGRGTIESQKKIPKTKIGQVVNDLVDVEV